MDKYSAMRDAVGGSQQKFRIATDDGGAVSGWRHAMGGCGVRIEQPNGVIRPATKDEVEAAGLVYSGQIREDVMRPDAPAGASVREPRV